MVGGVCRIPVKGVQWVQQPLVTAVGARSRSLVSRDSGQAIAAAAAYESDSAKDTQDPDVRGGRCRAGQDQHQHDGEGLDERHKWHPLPMQD